MTRDLIAAGAAVLAPSLSLRPADGSNEELLLRIFAESHCAGFELMGLEPAALDGLIRMQFQARQAQYRMHADAVEYLICRGEGGAADSGSAGGADEDGVPVGSCWLAEDAEQLRVLDIAVLAEHRRQGIARSVLDRLSARASEQAKPVRLSVWHANAPALTLYRDLGFLPDPEVGGSEPGDLGNGYLELTLPARATTQPSAGA
ncbi:MAG: GNAT family N-acetyltransferase [Jatrophihabitantaceae bacterium]